MKTTTIQAAKEQLDTLIDAAIAGEEIAISRAGVPVVRLLPLPKPKSERRFGTLKGKMRISDDFDAPLPDDIIADFEGG